MAEKKKVKADAPKPTKVTAIVMKEIALTPRQVGIVNAETPAALIKTKPGRGGKKVQYIEGGYVISKLNEAFSPLGWDFEIIEQGQTERKNENSAEGEVWVKGKLTIVDHVNGYRVSKTQYGQHPIHSKNPIGDAFKAAATDALKKCASMLGIGLDVYWGTLDQGNEETPKKQDPEALFEKARIMIMASNNIGGLIEYDEKLKESKTFNKDQQKRLSTLVKERVGHLETNQETHGS